MIASTKFRNKGAQPLKFNTKHYKDAITLNKALRRGVLTGIAAVLAGCAGACCFFEPVYGLGPMSAEAIRNDYPEFRQVYGNTAPATPLALAPGTEVLAFFGTWCHDSQREIPRYMRLSEASALKTTYIAVDRDKRDPAGQAARWRISKVPTFILLREGRELGRIVERPRVDLRTDLTELLAAAPLAADNTRPTASGRR